MKQRIAIAVVGVVLMAAVWLFIANRSVSEGSVYQGKSAKQWLADVGTPNEKVAIIAFQKMGTNAFPFLIRELKKKGTVLETLNRWIYPKLPASVKNWWGRPLTGPEQERRWDAVGRC